MYKRYNPATKLEQLYRDYKVKEQELIPYKTKASEEAVGDIVKYNLLLEADPEAVRLIEELRAIEEAYELELISVKNIYKELFKTHYLTINEIEEMTDINYKYLNRNVLPYVSTMYFSRLIRKDVKYYRKTKKHDELEETLFRNDVDIDKSLFISFEDFRNWFKDHVYTKDGMKPVDDLINKVIAYEKDSVAGERKGKIRPTLVGTEKYKNTFKMKYDMQLKRANKSRLYIFAEEDNKPISRIPLSPIAQNMLKELEEI